MEALKSERLQQMCISTEQFDKFNDNKDVEFAVFYPTFKSAGQETFVEGHCNCRSPPFNYGCLHLWCLKAAVGGGSVIDKRLMEVVVVEE